MSEPKITINSHDLNEGQAMTIRVALSLFYMNLGSDRNAIGEDELGRSMREAYMSRISEITRMMK